MCTKLSESIGFCGRYDKNILGFFGSQCTSVESLHNYNAIIHNTLLFQKYCEARAHRQPVFLCFANSDSFRFSHENLWNGTMDITVTCTLGSIDNLCMPTTVMCAWFAVQIGCMFSPYPFTLWQSY